MATKNITSTPTKTPLSHSINPKHQSSTPSVAATAMINTSRFEAYNRLQAAAIAFGEKLPIPEIVAIGGQSDGKSSLLEALLGFRFNVREVEMGTRRPLILQMVHDPSATEPRCRFQEEDSDEYGSQVVSATAIADIIKSRTEILLKQTKTAVSSKPIVMRAEYGHCPNLTIIDTPGFVLKARKGEPDSTPDEILSMVKALASPPHRIILFLQQSSVEWCSSLWLDAIKEIDPLFRRTIIVVSKFDNRLKEFTDRWEVDRYLSASGYLGENTRPFFVAIPKDRNIASNDEFRRQISKVDSDVVHYLRNDVNGGFDEEKFGSHIGFSSLREFLESVLHKKFKEATPSTLALLEQRCCEVTGELARLDSRIHATSDVAQLRRSAMLHAASVSSDVVSLIDGSADPSPEQWGKTTEQEKSQSGIGSWPGVTADVKPANSTLRLYGGAAFERVMQEFRCAVYSIQCPPVSREKVANIMLAHAGRCGGRGITEAAAEIARTAAKSWLSPLIDTACDRLAFVLGNLFDIALEKNRFRDSANVKINGNMDDYVSFHAAIRQSYSRFIQDLARQSKKLARHHLDSVTSPFFLNSSDNSFGSLGTTSLKFNPATIGSFSVELTDSHDARHDEKVRGQENIPPVKMALEHTPVKGLEGREGSKECQITVPETPSPEQPCEYAEPKKEFGNCVEVGPRKRVARLSGKNLDQLQFQNDPNVIISSKSGSIYAEICSSASLHFARIREILIERSVISTLNSGFLTPCRERLVVALALELFATSDEKFLDMFMAPGAIEAMEGEKVSLQKRQKMLQSCLKEFKSVARAL